MKTVVIVMKFSFSLVRVEFNEKKSIKKLYRTYRLFQKVVDRYM